MNIKQTFLCGAAAVAGALLLATPSMAQSSGSGPTYGTMNPNMTTAPAGAPGTDNTPSNTTGANPATTNGTNGTSNHMHHHHRATPASGSVNNGTMSNGSMNNNSNGSMSGPNSTNGSDSSNYPSTTTPH